MEGFYKRGDELSGYINVGEIIDQLRDFRHAKEDSASWNDLFISRSTLQNI